MDYKDTLLLPTTSFAMRGNLINNESKRYAAWDENKVYEKMKANRKDAPKFTLHDGPPYANGHIHIGHALNKVLKDIIVKHNYFNGKSVRFTPGWDCHGLPIEQQVEKKLGGKQKKELLQTAEVRKLCREHAAKFVDIQRDEFKTLGIIADWKKPYVTMDYKFEANIYRTLCGVANKGLLIERSKPVFWSWAERTALAEAEVEYQDKESHSIFIAFELDDAAKTKLNITGKAAPVIWTTTPWTIPANTAISFNPNEEYVLTDTGYIVAKELLNSLVEDEVITGKVVQTFKATEFENLKAINPLNKRESRLILGEHVLMDSGTGCVHTAPGHGEDDYRVGLLYDLEVVMPVDETGCFDNTIVKDKLIQNAEDFLGRHIFKSNDDLIDLMGDAVLKVSKFTHSYPHCWRSHTPLIFRATRQWFISVDEKPLAQDSTLRNIALTEIEKTMFIPETGRNRLKSMVENRPDWCISRQRDWGVPIAFFRVKATGEVIFDEKVMNYVAMIFEMQGSDAWYSMPTEHLLYPGSGYKADEVEKVTDILDVWFDSGSTWNSVLKSRNYDAGEYQADLYVEGSDQHRGWFQSSMFLSCAVEHKAPYKAVLTHGFTVDDKGEKMSKSKGNVIAPEKVLKEYGSEILRLWVASSDYQGDLKISQGILKQISENYRKLRNTFRIMLANINDLETLTAYEDMGALDQWILNVSSEVFTEVHKSFSEYNFVHGMSTLNNFIANELSGMYIDMTKDSLYCNAKNDPRRMASQSAMAIIAKRLLLLMAPILTYTCDEIIDHAPSIIKGDVTSIFDLVYEPITTGKSDFNAEYMTKAREGFGSIVDGLKKEKIIKSTLELVISTDSEIALALNAVDAEDWFVVSTVSNEKSQEILGSFEVEGAKFSIAKATAFKCPRCWKFQATAEDCTCKRCEEVVA
ncbi:isoleucine--tRNA ligase [Sulfurimonas sp.]|uniref:isoleucine--tRNA ligase n=1 Tax=Sulfurimonas sp. TaxID=2022749 RepID=UPI0025F71FB2|nr:isoleucine--tRNA ligase [Sulfurimonas sp.]MBT5934686.1 isoleucine--tRNA ligase [Sulfurimonas sp.]